MKHQKVMTLKDKLLYPIKEKSLSSIKVSLYVQHLGDVSTSWVQTELKHEVLFYAFHT